MRTLQQFLRDCNSATISRLPLHMTQHDMRLFFADTVGIFALNAWTHNLKKKSFEYLNIYPTVSMYIAMYKCAQPISVSPYLMT